MLHMKEISLPTCGVPRNSESQPQRDAAAASAASHGVSDPIDLSVLSQEKPSGRRNGCELTSEMAFPIFCKIC